MSQGAGKPGQINAYDAYTNDLFDGIDAAPAHNVTAYPGSANVYATEAPAGGQERALWDSPASSEKKGAAPSRPPAQKPAAAEHIAFTESTAQPHSPPSQGAASGAASPTASQAAAPGKGPWYTIRAYSGYFDVDTKEVGKRMMASLLFSRQFFADVEAKPDLYGPFWLSTTSIFLMAMVAAELSWLHHKSDVVWEFDAQKVGTCAAIFYGYVFVVGGLLYTYLAILNRAQIGLFSLWCIYGYSMTIWIPVTILSTIPLNGLSWVLVAAATLYSGIFLVLNLRQPVQESLSSTIAQGVTLLFVFAMHLVTGLLLKLLVFRYQFSSDDLSLSPPPPLAALAGMPPSAPPLR